MATHIILPKTNENMDEATIGRWYRAEGDAVSAGEPLLDVITDKATFQLEAPASGLLRMIVIPEKSVVPVGVILGLIAGPEEDLPDVTSHNAALLAGTKSELEAMADAAPALGMGGGRVRGTPGARRLARERGVDLARVADALGIQKRLTEEDVASYLQREGKA